MPPECASPHPTPPRLTPARQARTVEFSRLRPPKYLERELGKDVLDFLRGRGWRGHMSGHGHSKKRPLLTKLVGGIKMWRGERDFSTEAQHGAPAAPSAEPPTEAAADARESVATTNAAAPVVQFVDAC